MSMGAEVIVLVDIGGFGVAARLQVLAVPARRHMRTTNIPNPVGELVPSPRMQPEPEFGRSLLLAWHYTAAAVGWPTNHDVHWKIVPIADNLPIPEPNGPSGFGPFCMALMQAVVIDTPEAVRSCSDWIAPAIRSLCLREIAITAAYEPHAGSFEKVGEINLKLHALGKLLKKPAVCVVAQNQDDIRLPVLRERVLYTVFDSGVNTGGPKAEVAVVKATDPMDAYRKLFQLQMNEVIGQL